ncbi:hypothetical protein L209DRAFT_543634 [Thermothelomyces heterothallicus CBS 203.75]
MMACHARSQKQPWQWRCAGRRAFPICAPSFCPFRLISKKRRCCLALAQSSMLCLRFFKVMYAKACDTCAEVVTYIVSVYYTTNTSCTHHGFHGNFGIHVRRLISDVAHCFVSAARTPFPLRRLGYVVG